MTAQIPNTFIYKDMAYSIARESGHGLVLPFDIYGMNPRWVSTACYSGYQFICGLEGSFLVLTNFSVNLEKGIKSLRRRQGPDIGGISPIGRRYQDDRFNNHYEGLNVKVSYTGRLILARDFIQELYEHSGIQGPWKFREAVALIFKDGKLVKKYDCTRNVEIMRERILAKRQTALELRNLGQINNHDYH